MAKNDKILIDGIVDDRMSSTIPSKQRSEVFEYFAFEQMLKDYDLSKEEIYSGNIDGQNDGGIDGFYILVNGHLLVDADNFNWPKSGAILEVWIVTCKHHDTFKQAPLDSLVATITEIFDFTIENSNLKGDYSDELLHKRKCLMYAYRKVSPRLREFRVNYSYASRGDTAELGESIKSRSQQIEQITKDFFGISETSFHFLGSTELINLHRRIPNFSLELPFTDDLSSGETYIVLVKLKDYFNFISDDGKLRRYLFDSNVRDFMGLNRVNEDIKNTLLNDNSPDFWWLNNGITILATGASVIGKSIQIQDIQIVNGLQTSESIFRYFIESGVDVKNRSVLVKVIVSNNNLHRDEIIRATNNQTVVELSALHATDKIQRDIEEALKLEDFYYERRTNFYKNQGLPDERIITPLYLASGYVNLILKEPNSASTLKSKFMRAENSYNKVFSTNADLGVWSKIAGILKRTDQFLETKRPRTNGNGENFLKYRRQILSFLTVSRLLKSFVFTVRDLVIFDLKNFNSDELEYSWNLMKHISLPQFNKSKIRKVDFLQICKEMNADGQILGYESLLRTSGFNSSKIPFESITEQFLQSVNELLPEQPWPTGVHKTIANQLECSKSKVMRAIKILIQSGKRYREVNEMLYDTQNQIVPQNTPSKLV